MPPHATKQADNKPEDFEELQFINLTNNYCPDSNSKRVVRAHVMKKYRGDQRKKGKSSATPTRPVRELGNKLKLPKAGEVNRVSKLTRSTAAATTWIVEKTSPSGLHSPPRGTWQTKSHGKDIRDEIQETVSTNDTQLVRLPKILGAGRIDPLNSLPIKNSRQTAYLIDHFNQFIGWRVSQIPNTFFAKFFQFSLTDEAVAHAMMIYAANHNQWTTGRSRQPDIVHHHNEAIKILRSRINSSTPDISDETIVTIAGLVIFLEMFGSSEAANTHRAGLQRTVELRGGVHELGNQLVSAQFVYGALISPVSVEAWQKKYIRNPTYTTPYLTPPPQTPSPPPFPLNWNTPSKTPTVIPKSSYLSTCECSSQHEAYPPTPEGWDEIMKETFTRLIDSSSLASSTLHTEHHFPIQNESYLVENRVGTLIEGFETEDRSGRNVKVVYGKSWLLACRLYIYAVLRCSERRAVRDDVLEGLVAELRECLDEEFRGYGDFYDCLGRVGEREAVDRFREKYFSPNVLLWILLIAGSNTNTHFKWFSTGIGDLSKNLGISKWSQVKDRMDKLPWVEWKLEDGCRGFWEGVVSEVG